jgi:hypothetical protein
MNMKEIENIHRTRQLCESEPKIKLRIKGRGNMNIVTCMPIARQRLGKDIPAEANACNNRTSISRQRISKHASLIIEAVFSAWAVRSGYREVFGSIEQSRTAVESSFERPGYQDMSLGT